jgi:1,4-dihydroxy-6-naphthoate synthase
MEYPYGYSKLREVPQRPDLIIGGFLELSLKISPCPNDTFIFEEWIQGGLTNSTLRVAPSYCDIQTLNEFALKQDADLIKISSALYPQIKQDYHLLDCGGAMGYGCGPLLLGSDSPIFHPQKTVYLPGLHTTASLLFRFWQNHNGYLGSKLKYQVFDVLYKGLVSGQISQGVVIHESRFTYAKEGLHLIQDLGAFWESQTNSPIPLGVVLLHKRHSKEVATQCESLIRQSLETALNRSNKVTPFIKNLAQIPDDAIVLAHIHTYVNGFSKSMGDPGRRALAVLETIFCDLATKF